MRSILHVDMDAFYASIEQRDRPGLRGKPVIVGGSAERRGVVSAASYEARTFGVHSALPSAEAHRRCPDGIFLPVRMEHYAEVSRELMHILESFSPILQKLSIDEAFLDVTGCLHLWEDDAVCMATALKAKVREELDLAASVGVAPNKFLAKLASDLDKPDGLTVTPTDQDDIEAWLAPMPVSRIWGVGRKTGSRLRDYGITTVGELQGTSEEQLRDWFGDASAEKMSRLARGLDLREVETETVEKSISAETTFDTDVNDLEQLRKVLIRLSEKVGRRVRKAGWYAGTVHIKVRYNDFSTLTRQEAFDAPTHHDADIIRHAIELFDRVKINRSLRLLGVGVSQLVDDPESLKPAQQDLFAETREDAEDDARKEALDRAVDELRNQYGTDSLKRGEW